MKHKVIRPYSYLDKVWVYFSWIGEDFRLLHKPLNAR
jgi:hypothetical protein